MYLNFKYIPTTPNLCTAESHLVRKPIIVALAERRYYIIDMSLMCHWFIIDLLLICHQCHIFICVPSNFHPNLSWLSFNSSAFHFCLILLSFVFHLASISLPFYLLLDWPTTAIQLAARNHQWHMCVTYMIPLSARYC